MVCNLDARLGKRSAGANRFVGVREGGRAQLGLRYQKTDPISPSNGRMQYGPLRPNDLCLARAKVKLFCSLLADLVAQKHLKPNVTEHAYEQLSLMKVHACAAPKQTRGGEWRGAEGENDWNSVSIQVWPGLVCQTGAVRHEDL